MNSHDIVTARFPRAVCLEHKPNGFAVLSSSATRQRISAYHLIETDAWDDARKFVEMLPGPNVFSEYEKRQREELERAAVEKQMKEQAEALRKRNNEKAVSSQKLARFADLYGYTVDVTSDADMILAARQKVEWVCADRGNLARIANATEEALEEQRKTRAAIEKIAKLAGKLDEVIQLFKIVLEPVAKDVLARRHTEDGE